jgi:predicted component of type VI protein secretion system
MSADMKIPPIPDHVNAIAAFWTQWLEQSARGTQALLEAMQTTTDPKAIQKLTLDTLSDTVESFMRTPAFMEIMKRNMKAMTDYKMMQDQVIRGTARQLGLPLGDDIFGLFERLHSTEQTILSRLEAIENRLSAIEAQVKPESNGSRR